LPYPLNLAVLGTAGSGKTTLTRAFGRWMGRELGRRVAFVNLDPGAERLPFRPSFDLRRHFTLRGLMRRYGLGPNGAMVRASQLLERGAEGFAGEIRGVEAEVRLLDTPGQLEVFLFHGGGKLLSLLDGTTLSLFLLEARTVLDPAGLTLARLLNLSVQLRLGVPTLCVVNKVDQLGRELEEELREALPRLEGLPGVEAELAGRLSSLLKDFLPPARLVGVSARRGEGMERLHDLVHEVFCACGDLT
jgi:GTPase SAR1 family protein